MPPRAIADFRLHNGPSCWCWSWRWCCWCRWSMCARGNGPQSVRPHPCRPPPPGPDCRRSNRQPGSRRNRVQGDATVGPAQRNGGRGGARGAGGASGAGGAGGAAAVAGAAARGVRWWGWWRRCCCCWCSWSTRFVGAGAGGARVGGGGGGSVRVCVHVHVHVGWVGGWVDGGGRRHRGGDVKLQGGVWARRSPLRTHDSHVQEKKVRNPPARRPPRKISHNEPGELRGRPKKLSQGCSSLAVFMCASSGPNSINMGRFVPHVGHMWPTFGPNWPIWVEIGKIWAKFEQTQKDAEHVQNWATRGRISTRARARARAIERAGLRRAASVAAKSRRVFPADAPSCAAARAVSIAPLLCADRKKPAHLCRPCCCEAPPADDSAH